MDRIYASLFGRFSLQRFGQPIEGRVAPKAQELLSYLILNRRHPHTRESLSELLWGDHPPEKSRKYLRQALWRLQSVLESNMDGGSSLLRIEPGWIQFDPKLDCWVDVEEFEGVYLQVISYRARELSVVDFESIRRTVALYRGNFLEGCYQDWCMIERERYQRMYIMLLDKLVQYCEVHEDFDAGLAYGNEILYFDRAYERAHRQLMRLYQMAGDRTQALRQYERCADALREELSVAPSERTTQLYQQIRADSYRAPAFLGKAELQTDSAGLKKVLIQLEAYAETLDNMRAQVHRDIQAIEDRLSVPR
jgi:DNA-binding SARP family transcriptional activator